MKLRLLIVLLLPFALCQAAFATKSATVEARGAFLKITDAEKPVGAPVEVAPGAIAQQAATLGKNEFFRVHT